MRGDLGSPLVRAYVRAERVKRAHRAGGPVWARAIAFRGRLVGLMTEREQDQAMELVDVERRYGRRK